MLDQHYHFFGPGVPGESLLEKWGVVRLALMVVVIAPWIETFIGQADFLLAFTYLHGRKHSRLRAIWMTASVHMLVNLSVTVAYALGRLGVP